MPALNRVQLIGRLGKDPEGKVVEPDFVVDIGAAFVRKREMLAEHASQRVWLQQHHGVDSYLDEMEKWTRARGALAGYEFGEGFRRYRGHAYPQSGLLEELLGVAVAGSRISSRAENVG